MSAEHTVVTVKNHTDREPNSVGYWRSNTIEGLEITLSCWPVFEYPLDEDYRRELDEDRRRHESALRDAKAMQAKVRARYARIYGKKQTAEM